MEDINIVPESEPPAMPFISWEDMVEELFHDPVQDSGTPGFPGCKERETIDLVEDFLEGFDGGFEGIVGNFQDAETRVGSGEEQNMGSCWTNYLRADPGVDVVTNELLLSECLDASSTEYGSLPDLASENSSLVRIESPNSDDSKTSVEIPEVIHHQAESNSRPDSSNWIGGGRILYSNFDEDVGNASSHSNSSNQTSCDSKAASPDTGSDSSEVGARGRTCDNFASELETGWKAPPNEGDEESKRRLRLERNRESASQSRLRKKSYVKDLEAKCRAMESQLTMLRQTVAYTSAQNNALREELAHFKCLKGNGSKSGVVEPAALPSDSLPSESPSHHTSRCLSVKWELVAFLCHVLLLTHLQALHPKLALSGGSPPSKPRSERRNISVSSHAVCRSRKSAHSARSRRQSSNRHRGRRRKSASRLYSRSLTRIFKFTDLANWQTSRVVVSNRPVD